MGANKFHYPPIKYYMCIINMGKIATHVKILKKRDSYSCLAAEFELIDCW